MTEPAKSLKKYEEYKKWTNIDRYNLDEEVSQHPALHQQIGEALAEAKNMRDLAEVNIDIVKSDINSRYRKDALEEAVKVTEDSVKAYVTSHPKVVTVQQEYLNWKHITELWYSLDKAFGERWPMLQELGRLTLAGYYERPSIKGVDRTRLAQSVREDQTRHRLNREVSPKSFPKL